ncbi:flagellar protein FliT [Noviherbaspirillum sedimenti]|uniref:Flagellar protein FliT n=1 Tax=Noviherbaspirillum sedimenti TaxID=2320865 RepID=A0A3A3G0J8_9BURK|nr:flagellar protein FliT [Noviherbaspirillum sedimenti]RJG01155.1 flagellar protein FliT [Noviherbaspirillum sedimenti]
MNSHEVISLYETVAVITEQMLTAARNGDWDQLAVLESRCASQVEILRKSEHPAPLTGVVREKKVKIIKKILADDREIRNLTEPWMAQLSQLINSTGTERKLSQAYGATHSG